MEDAKKVLSIAFRKLIGEIDKYGKEDNLPLKERHLVVLIIKDALKLMRLALEEFGKKINEISKDLDLKGEKVAGLATRD